MSFRELQLTEKKKKEKKKKKTKSGKKRWRVLHDGALALASKISSGILYSPPSSFNSMVSQTASNPYQTARYTVLSDKDLKLSEKPLS